MFIFSPDPNGYRALTARDRLMADSAGAENSGGVNPPVGAKGKTLSYSVRTALLGFLQKGRAKDPGLSVKNIVPCQTKKAGVSKAI